MATTDPSSNIFILVGMSWDGNMHYRNCVTGESNALIRAKHVLGVGGRIFDKISSCN